MKLSTILLPSLLAQSPDLKPDHIGRAAMTPDEGRAQNNSSLEFYTDLSTEEINSLVSGIFDISKVKLDGDNLGFFRTMTGAMFMDVHFDYEKFDGVEPSADVFSSTGPGAFHKMGIREYSGCGVDQNGESFKITDGYITSDGTWQFNKIYTGKGPASWTHGWRYLGNMVGQVWSGGLQRIEDPENSKFLTQTFFFPTGEQKVSCSRVTPLTTLPTLPTTSPATFPTIPVTNPTTTTEVLTNNQLLVNRCGTRLRQLKGIYGMEEPEARVQRQLHKRFTNLENILDNAINMNRPGRHKVQNISTGKWQQKESLESPIWKVLNFSTDHAD